jgi:hypothetical protein
MFYQFKLSDVVGRQVFCCHTTVTVEYLCVLPMSILDGLFISCALKFGFALPPCRLGRRGEGGGRDIGEDEGVEGQKGLRLV